MGKQSFTALKFCQATRTTKEWSSISIETLRPFLSVMKLWEGSSDTFSIARPQAGL